VKTVKRQATGKVVFSRSCDGNACICCPGGVHVFARGIERNGVPFHVMDWFYDKVLRQVREGKKVKITVEWKG
jgi:hypothetical protein